MSKLLLPLTALTKNKMPNRLVITDEVQIAFEQIKAALCSPQVLRTARFDRYFIIQSDASEHAIGACLTQLDDDGSEHPIASVSCKITDTQCKWAQLRRKGMRLYFHFTSLIT